jgi:hypothetical protein
VQFGNRGSEVGALSMEADRALQSKIAHC